MVEMANKYNDLNGKEWLQYSFSIWRNVRKEDEERKLQHPAMFPVQLSERAIDIFSKVYKGLKTNGHCVVVLMDIRKKDKFYPFHSDFANKMQEIGFTFEDIIIWDRQHEYNNMRPLGYPYVFRVNKVHEYILIFKKKGH